MGFSVVVVVVVVVLFGQRMKKVCDVFNRIEFQDYSADKGIAKTNDTQDSSRL